MKVRSKRPWPVEIASKEFSATVEAGGTVEVPKPVGESLIRQSDAWEVSNEADKKAVSKETK